jgi:hypothetical protein
MANLSLKPKGSLDCVEIQIIQLHTCLNLSFSSTSCVSHTYSVER